jgi:hypothetical protein
MGPIVMSYGDGNFPNRYVAGWEPSADGAQWDDLPATRQWQIAERELRGRCPSRQISPTTMDRRFGPGYTAFDLLSAARPL